MIAPYWVTAFLDLPSSSFVPAVEFWQEVTGYGLSAARGERREFATLEPDEGDAFLKAQRVLEGPGGIHLDLHVEDPGAAADLAVAVGAVPVSDGGHVVLRSPGGLLFCLVPHPASLRPAAVGWEDGHRSQVDQVCLDIPSRAYDEECAFWATLTGWDLQGSGPEFRSLLRPPEMPLRFLLQRLGEPSGTVRAHLDLAAEDRVAEVNRHARLGASVVAERRSWTVLRDPVGSTYCVTDRDPETGLLPGPPAR